MHRVIQVLQSLRLTVRKLQPQAGKELTGRQYILCFLFFCHSFLMKAFQVVVVTALKHGLMERLHKSHLKDMIKNKFNAWSISGRMHKNFLQKLNLSFKDKFNVKYLNAMDGTE